MSLTEGIQPKIEEGNGHGEVQWDRGSFVESSPRAAEDYIVTEKNNSSYRQEHRSESKL